MKIALGGRNLLYPMPVTIVGVHVKGKVNFINIAHVGILNSSKPHVLSLSMAKSHYTNQGIHQNKELSINILSSKHAVEVDWMGLVSGKNTDKSQAFSISYGSLKTAPLINEAPLSMECRVIDTVDRGSHDLFIVEVVESWADQSVLLNGKVDMNLIDPILFDMNGPWYYALGAKIGQCWNIGKGYDPAL